MAHMLLFGFRQEHIEFRDNLVHAFCRDMRTLRVCHANRQTALRLRRRPSASLLWRAANHLPREWLAYFYFISMRGEPS